MTVESVWRDFNLVLGKGLFLPSSAKTKQFMNVTAIYQLKYCYSSGD